MFARQVSMHLKPNSVAELTQRLEKEVVPMLRKLKGFHDEVTFVNHRGTEAFAISLWDQAENAEVYSRSIYPAIVKILSGADRRHAGRRYIRRDQFYLPQDRARRVRLKKQPPAN